MALIYRPNALYMSPRNESVDVTNGLDLSFTFKGYQMYSAYANIYQNVSGEWQKVPNGAFTFAGSAAAPYYNNEKITCTVNSSNYPDIFNLIKSFKNVEIGWGLTLFGMPSVQVAAADNKMIPQLKGFETGNKVQLFSGSGISTPDTRTYIDNYDFKLALGTALSGTDIDGTNVDNAFSISEGVFATLTTGDMIATGISSGGAWSNRGYIYKINEGAANPAGYYIRLYNTKANAIAGGTTGVISGSTMQNKSYYVNPTTATSNRFYIGLVGSGYIKLYTTKEAALQSVEEAAITLTQGDTYTIRMTEESQIIEFIPIIANSIVFDPNDWYQELTLSAGEVENSYIYSGVTLYTGQQIYATSTSGLTDFFYIRVGVNGDNTLAVYRTREAALNSYGYLLVNLNLTKDVYLSEIMNEHQEFTIKWSDSTDIPIITSWYAELYNIGVDSDENIISKRLIEKSPVQYSAEVKYTFNHLLLSYYSIPDSFYQTVGAIGADKSDAGRYQVVFTLIDDHEYVYTGTFTFDVGYGVKEVGYSPTVIVDNCDSSVTVNWANAVSITGSYSGAQQKYIEEAVDVPNNNGAIIEATKNLSFNANISGGFPTFLFQCDEDANFDGTIIKLDGTGQTATLSYNKEGQAFVFAVLNKYLNTTIYVVVDTDVRELNPNMVYLIGYADGHVYIREYKQVSYRISANGKVE